MTVFYLSYKTFSKGHPSFRKEEKEYPKERHVDNRRVPVLALRSDLLFHHLL